MIEYSSRPLFIFIVSWTFFLTHIGAASKNDLCDTTAMLVVKNKSSYHQMTSYGNPIPFTANAAIFGNKGLQLQSTVFGHTDRKFKTHLLAGQKEIWQRFYVRFDSMGSDFSSNKTAEKTISLFLVNVITTEQRQNNDIATLMTFKFLIDLNKKGLFLSVSPNAAYSKQRLLVPIDKDTIYCVESKVSFLTSDSIEALFYFNGIESAAWRLKYPYNNDFFSIDIQSHFREADFPITISMDEIAISDNRLFSIPNTAVSCSSIISNGKIRMCCKRHDTNYFGEDLSQVRWRIFMDTCQVFPLFDVVEYALEYFSEYAIPFTLHRGTYWWQTSHRNNFGNWSYWSNPVIFDIDKTDAAMVSIRNTYFSTMDNSRRLSEIQRERWHTVTVEINNLVAWDSLLYLIVWLNDTSYTYGHPANKGGQFCAASSYICNLNLYKGEYAFFEKNVENSFLTSRVPIGHDGLYIRQSDKNFKIDTTVGIISFDIRLLQNASIGLWNISSAVVYRDLQSTTSSPEAITPVFKSNFMVIAGDGSYKSNPWTLLLSSLLIVLAIIVSRRIIDQKNNKQLLSDKTIDDKIFDDISSYISDHITESLRVKNITTTFHINEKHFYRIMAGKNTSFNRLVNEIRIGKAKNLLMTNQEMSIEQISIAVGYSASNNFASVFKKFENISPKDFRRNSKQ